MYIRRLSVVLLLRNLVGSCTVVGSHNSLKRYPEQEILECFEVHGGRHGVCVIPHSVPSCSSAYHVPAFDDSGHDVQERGATLEQAEKGTPSRQTTRFRRSGSSKLRFSVQAPSSRGPSTEITHKGLPRCGFVRRMLSPGEKTVTPRQHNNAVLY